MQDTSNNSTTADRAATSNSANGSVAGSAYGLPIAPAQPPRWPSLSHRQIAFVEAYVRNGGKSGLASTQAGYSGREAGSRLLQLPHILKAITELQTDVFAAGAVTAAHTLMRLMKHARSDYVKLEAATRWLDRAGFKPVERVDHRVAADLSVSFDTGGVENGGVRDVTPLSRIETDAEALQPEDE